MDRMINWLATIDPTTRVGAGMGLVLVAIILFILGLSHYRDWPAQQPVPASHVQRWYRVRQRPAGSLTARLKAEHDLRDARLAAGRDLAAALFEISDPVGRPTNLVPYFEFHRLETQDALFDLRPLYPLAISASPDPVWLADAFVDTQTLERVT